MGSIGSGSVQPRRRRSNVCADFLNPSSPMRWCHSGCHRAIDRQSDCSPGAPVFRARRAPNAALIDLEDGLPLPKSDGPVRQSRARNPSWLRAWQLFAHHLKDDENKEREAEAAAEDVSEKRPASSGQDRSVGKDEWSHSELDELGYGADSQRMGMMVVSAKFFSPRRRAPAAAGRPHFSSPRRSCTSSDARFCSAANCLARSSS